MNRDTINPRNLSPDTLTETDRAAYRSHGTPAAWLAGCECDGCRLMARVNGTVRPEPRTPRPPRSVPLVDATAFAAIARSLIARGYAPYRLAEFCGVGPHMIADIVAGKRKVRQSSAAKLRRLLELLPSGVA